MIFDEYFDCYGGRDCSYSRAYDDGHEDGYGWDYECEMLDDWIIEWTDDLVHENCPMLYGFKQNVDLMMNYEL